MSAWSTSCPPEPLAKPGETSGVAEICGPPPRISDGSALRRCCRADHEENVLACSYCDALVGDGRGNECRESPPGARDSPGTAASIRTEGIRRRRNLEPAIDRCCILYWRGSCRALPSGASSLSLEQHCMPDRSEQLHSMMHGCSDGLQPLASSAAVAAKWPTPGTMSPAERRTRPWTGTVKSRHAVSALRTASGARAIVDSASDSSSYRPFLSPLAASRSSRAKPRAARERTLKTASLVCSIRP